MRLWTEEDNLPSEFLSCVWFSFLPNLSLLKTSSPAFHVLDLCIKTGAQRGCELQRHSLAEGFHSFASKCSYCVGTKWAFAIALLSILGWALTGPTFHYSDTWQLVVNTATTIVTFLMVFLIQNTQNRDAKAFHLKLDEIIRALHSASNQMIDVEKLPDEELEALAAKYEAIRRACEARKKPKAA
jgi:low affinity Fe/Cu permease